MIIVNYVGWSGSGVVGSGLVLFLPEGRGTGLFLKQQLAVEPGGWYEGDYGSIIKVVLFCSGSMFPREKEILLDVF